MSEADQDYYTRRYSQEVKMVASAVSSAAAAAHHALALSYAEKLRRIGARRRRLADLSEPAAPSYHTAG